MKKVLLFLFGFGISTSYAQEIAQYSVGLGLSPFGGSLQLGYVVSEKTSFNIGVGTLPESDSPFSPEIGEERFDITSSSDWMGFFINHRPFQSADWFRINTGIAVGSIFNSLQGDQGSEFEVNFTENPVTYLGIGLGLRPIKGFTYGFDAGLLYGSGPALTGLSGGLASSASPEEVLSHPFFAKVLPNIQFGVAYGF